MLSEMLKFIYNLPSNWIFPARCIGVYHEQGVEAVFEGQGVLDIRLVGNLWGKRFFVIKVDTT
jgi:hypothetical protein